MSETSSKIRRFPLTADDWTPIVAPGPCNYYGLWCEEGCEMLASSDPTNEQAWYRMTSSYALTAPRIGPHRFLAGDTVVYLKAAQGSPTAVGIFIL